jgi:putative nucleotidyltransferase-like protein
MKAAELDRYLTEYSRTSSWNRIKFEKLRVVLSHMRDEGIDYILLKGADVVPRLYGVLGLRALGDVDMLVHEFDLPRLDHVLTRLSYRPRIDGNPAYADRDSILALDIVTNVWYVLDQALIWQRAVQRDFGGLPIRGLGTNDLLIYLIAYSAVHRGYVSTSLARDVALLARKEEVDWDFVVDEVCRCHLKIPIYHGLSFVLTRWAAAPIPDHVLRRLAPSTVIERLWSVSFEKLVTEKPVPELGHLLLFLTRPGWKKWRWLTEAFFPHAAFFKYRYGDQWTTHPSRTRLSRPFQLLARAAMLFVRVIRRLVTARV